jgi:hypothetical protein
MERLYFRVQYDVDPEIDNESKGNKGISQPGLMILILGEGGAHRYTVRRYTWYRP